MTCRKTPSQRIAAVIATALMALSGGGAMAQAAAPAPAAAPPAATVKANPALYVVRDRDTTIYLFGTVHLLPANVDWNHGKVKRAFDSAQELRLEVAGINDDPAALQQLTLRRGLAPEGSTLTTGMSDQDKATVMKAITDAGLPPQALDRMRPWLASITMAAVTLQRLGLDPNKGADKLLEQAAKAANKPVTGFETAEQQIGFFADMSEDLQRAMLVSGARDMDQAPAMMNAMLDAWSKGDSERLGSIMNEGMRATPELARIILTDRNRTWAQWIDTRMDQPGTVFIAVGAGHLAGTDSVQAFLRQHGHRARRVR